MDYLSEHRLILEQASRGELPDEVNGNCAVAVWAVRDLVEDGMLRAIETGNLDGKAYLEPRITIAGREYLNELNRRRIKASLPAKAKRLSFRLLDWVGGILAGLILAWVTMRWL